MKEVKNFFCARQTPSPQESLSKFAKSKEAHHITRASHGEFSGVDFQTLALPPKEVLVRERKMTLCTINPCAWMQSSQNISPVNQSLNHVQLSNCKRRHELTYEIYVSRARDSLDVPPRHNSAQDIQNSKCH